MAPSQDLHEEICSYDCSIFPRTSSCCFEGKWYLNLACSWRLYRKQLGVEAQLPPPRWVSSVDAGMSDGELFVAALKDSQWSDPVCDSVPGLLLLLLVAEVWGCLGLWC